MGDCRSALERRSFRQVPTLLCISSRSANLGSARTPPMGTVWSHEIKFDGYRIQLHKRGDVVVASSRNGTDFTRRAGRAVVSAVRGLQCVNCVLDGELIGFDDQGAPSFAALHSRPRHLGAVAFDLLGYDDEDLRAKPLEERRHGLSLLFPASSALARADTFDAPIALLESCERQGLEGIVSKRTDRPYHSGPCPDWIKVKTRAWRAAYRERHRLFDPIARR